MDKLLSMMGLARRAGKLTLGFDASIGLMRTGGAYGVLLAANLSEKTEKNIRFEAEKASVPVVRTEASLEAIAAAIGKKAGVITFGDRGFWGAVLKLTQAGHLPGDVLTEKG